MDEYIARFPEDIQEMLEEIRATVKKAAPEAEETIKYGMPTFILNGNLVYFAAFKNHIGFYPAPRGIKELEKEISTYKGAKSSLKFLPGKPLPLALISNIVKYRMIKNLEKAKIKTTKK